MEVCKFSRHLLILTASGLRLTDRHGRQLRVAYQFKGSNGFIQSRSTLLLVDMKS